MRKDIFTRLADMPVGYFDTHATGDIISRIKSQDVQIYDVEIDHGREEKLRNPSAVFSIRLNHKQMHTQVLAAISELESVRTIDEI